MSLSGSAAVQPHDPDETLRTINIVTQILTLTFCSIFFFTRVWFTLRMLGTRFSLDDCLTFISWLLMIGYCVCGIILSVHGGGHHIWEVPPIQVEKYFQTAYAATLFYAPMTLFIKLSLLTLIARVFSPYKRRVQAIWGLAGLLVVYYLIALVLKIRVCWPISAYWKGETSRCLDQSALITADSIISTVTDTIILILPLPMTWSLQLPLSKKCRIGGMLAIGGLATAFSAWRLHLILTEGKSTDATVLFVKVVMSGNAEAGLAFICICTPALVAQLKIARAGIQSRSSRLPDHPSGAHGAMDLKYMRSRSKGLGSKDSASYNEPSDTALMMAPQSQPNEAQLGGIRREYKITQMVSHDPFVADYSRA